MSPRHLRTSVGSVAVLIVLLTGCTSLGTPDTEPSTATPVNTPTPTPAPTLAAATCENIMTPEFLASTTLIPQSWSADELAADAILADGIGCTWSADPTVGTDNVLAFGWAPMTEDAWAARTAEFTNSELGWFVEDGTRGEYLTTKADEDFWLKDDAGYSATYLYTGTHVIFALTKAETDLVTGPPTEG